MTAGQRNCYEALGECMRNYSIHDVVEALRVHVDEQRGLAPVSEKRAESLHDVAIYISRIQEKLLAMPAR